MGVRRSVGYLMAISVCVCGTRFKKNIYVELKINSEERIIAELKEQNMGMKEGRGMDLNREAH